MRRYFEKMTSLGKELKENEKTQGRENANTIAGVEKEVEKAIENKHLLGLPDERIHKRGEKQPWSGSNS